MAKINSWGSDDPVLEANGGTATATATTGDILYSDATNSLAKLAVGTDGHILTVATDVPNWEAGSGTAGWTPLVHTTASDSNLIGFDSTYITSTYDVYLFVWHNLNPAADANIRIRFGPTGTGDVRTTGYLSNVFDTNSTTGTTATTYLDMTKTAIESTTTEGGAISFTMVTNPTSASIKTTAMTWIGFRDTGDNQIGRGYGRYDTAEAQAYIQFTPLTTTIGNGEVYLYGLTKP